MELFIKVMFWYACIICFVQLICLCKGGNSVVKFTPTMRVMRLVLFGSLALWAFSLVYGN